MVGLLAALDDLSNLGREKQEANFSTRPPLSIGGHYRGGELGYLRPAISPIPRTLY